LPIPTETKVFLIPSWNTNPNTNRNMLPYNTNPSTNPSTLPPNTNEWRNHSEKPILTRKNIYESLLYFHGYSKVYQK
jgi:hypothetical protein